MKKLNPALNLPLIFEKTLIAECFQGYKKMVGTHTEDKYRVCHT